MTAEEWNYTFDKEYPEGVKEPIKKKLKQIFSLIIGFTIITFQ